MATRRFCDICDNELGQETGSKYNWCFQYPGSARELLIISEKDKESWIEIAKFSLLELCHKCRDSISSAIKEIPGRKKL